MATKIDWLIDTYFFSVHRDSNIDPWNLCTKVFLMRISFLRRDIHTSKHQVAMSEYGIHIWAQPSRCFSLVEGIGLLMYALQDKGPLKCPLFFIYIFIWWSFNLPKFIMSTKIHIGFKTSLCVHSSLFRYVQQLLLVHTYCERGLY